MSKVEAAVSRQRSRTPIPANWLLPPAAAALAAGLGIAIGYSGTGLLVVLALSFCAGAALVMARPWAGPVALVPALLVPSLPQVGPILPDLFAGLVASALLALHFALTGLPTRPRSSVLAYCAVLATSTIAITAASGANVREASYLGVAMFVGIALGQLLHERPGAAKCLGLIAVGIALLAVFETLIGDHIWPLYRAGERYTLADDPGARRAFSTLGHPLIAGAGLAILATIAVSADRSRWRFVIFTIVVVGSVTTVSRSAMLALLLAAMAALVLDRKNRSRTFLSAAAVLLVGAVAVASIPNLQLAFTSRVLESQEQQTVRAISIQQARESFANEPIGTAVGQGVGSGYDRIVRQGGIQGLYTYDNQYVTLFYDIGWLPLLAALGWGAGLLWTNRRAVPLGIPAVLAAAVIAGFTDILIWPSITLLAWTAFGFAVGQPSGDARNQRK